MSVRSSCTQSVIGRGSACEDHHCGDLGQSLITGCRVESTVVVCEAVTT